MTWSEFIAVRGLNGYEKNRRRCPFFSVVAWGGFSTVRNEGLSEKHVERQMDSQAGRRALPPAAARPTEACEIGPERKEP